MSATDNLILRTDSYKMSHWKQYPPGTERVYAYMETRNNTHWNDHLFFGLQYILKENFGHATVTRYDLKHAAELARQHFGNSDILNVKGWNHIINKHGGSLPLRIMAVPEGSVVPFRNVLMTVENTDPEVPWLTTYVEGLLDQIWYPMTVATQSHHLRKTIKKFLEDTGTPDGLFGMVHDFGFRGSTSTESAAIGGAAHLISFSGTDNLPALTLLQDYYGDTPVSGFSIPAAEHSTITAWGQSSEEAAYLNMLKQYPTGAVACVSDSFDVFRACSEYWGNSLRDKVMGRDGVLVIRPDSGEPVDTVLRVLNILGDKFPVSPNQKGYKVLDPHVRVIQGDGIDPEMVHRILAAMKLNGWSADNIAFGSGGGLLQKMDRDTLGVTMKCSAVQINGEWAAVRKTPATDPRKTSKGGRLALNRYEMAHAASRPWMTVAEERERQVANELKIVYENGYMMNGTTTAGIRSRAFWS